MRYILCLLFFSFACSSQVFIPAKLLDNANKKYREDSFASRVESYAYISFVINKEGKATDIVVLDKSDFRDISGVAKQWLKNLTYQPARISDKPINSEKRLLWRYDKALSSGSNDGISPRFAQSYEKTKSLVKDNAVKAEHELINVKQATKNLTEQAFYAFISSFVYAQTKDWLSYGEHVFDAWMLKDFLDNHSAYMATKNLFDYALYKQDYRLALEVANSFKTLSGIEISAQVYQSYYDSVQQSIEQRKEITKRYSISQELPVYHAITRRKVQLETASDNVEAQLRCKNHVENVSITEMLLIPSTAIDCRLLVRATEDTELTIVESGAVHIKLGEILD
ncbi:energy transducer TonB [Thalassotalea montiporae]